MVPDPFEVAGAFVEAPGRGVDDPSASGLTVPVTGFHDRPGQARDQQGARRRDGRDPRDAPTAGRGLGRPRSLRPRDERHGVHRRRLGHRSGHGHLRPRDLPPDGRTRAVVRVAAQSLPAPLDDLPGSDAILRIGGETAGDQRSQLLGQGRQVGFRVHDPVQHADRGAVPVQRFPQRGERGCLSQGEDVGGGGDVTRRRLFGSHELRCSDRGGRRRVPTDAGGQRDTEVDHPRPVRGQQDVRRFQVAVDDARAVDGLQRLGHPRHQPQHRLHRQGSAPGHHLRQGGTGHIERGEPGRSAVRVRVDQLGRVGTPDPPGRLYLPAEPVPEVR